MASPLKYVRAFQPTGLKGTNKQTKEKVAKHQIVSDFLALLFFSSLNVPFWRRTAAMIEDEEWKKFPLSVFNGCPAKRFFLLKNWWRSTEK